MKKTILGLLCLTASLQANDVLVAAQSASKPAKKNKNKKISYDTDLFRKNKKVLFVNAEFLYWTINESALDYALQMKKPAWGNPTEGVGHYKIIDFGWNPGFRVNVGYFNAPHYWDAFLQYTYFKGKGHDDAHAPSESNLFLNGTWPQPSSGEVPLRKADSSIEMKLDLLEFLCTRRFHPNPHLRMRLYGGPSVAWVRQNWEIDYRDTANQTSHLHSHWRFTGAGIRAGYMVDWFLGKGGFFFTGLVSAAVYAGQYHNVSKQKSSDSSGGHNPNLPLRNVHYHDTRLIPHFQVLGGPSWQMAFTNYRTELFIGYELNFWTNLHEVYRTSSSAPTQAKQTFINNSVMGTQGLTVRWNLDF
jgi:hypothetical protein